MTSPANFTAYSTVEPYITVLPAWVPAAEQLRIAAYGKYEEIYWSSEEGFIEAMRGDNEVPVFMPTARIMVNTINRYTAPGFGWTISPLSEEAGSPGDVLAIARLAFNNLFAREGFIGKFNANKLQGLRQGDWLWHIVADPAKPLGKRLSIYPVEPASYFPIPDPENPDRIVKVHLAELQDVDGTEMVSRLTYERLFDEAGNQTGIVRSHGLFEVDGWMDSTSPERVILGEEPLPELIPAIPVYHIPNGDSIGPFGDSEMRGMESVLLDINQVMSDESVTLALDGIGVYATEGGAPKDAQGNDVDWVMGPGRVLAHAKGLTRINGATSVTPYGEHYDRLFESVRMAAGAGDVAMGKSGQAAQSGLALLLELGPMLAHTELRDQRIKDVHRQMLYDLCFWMQEFDELPLIGTSEGNTPAPLFIVEPTFSSKVPVDRKELVREVEQLRSLVPPVISLRTAHIMLKFAGLPIQDDEEALVLAEQASALEAFAGGNEEADADARVEEEIL